MFIFYKKIVEFVRKKDKRVEQYKVLKLKFDFIVFFDFKYQIHIQTFLIYIISCFKLFYMINYEYSFSFA